MFTKINPSDLLSHTTSVSYHHRGGRSDPEKDKSTAEGERTSLFSLQACLPDSSSFIEAPIGSSHLKVM